MATERAGSWPVTARQALTNDRDARRVRGVSIIKFTAFHQANMQQPEIFRANGVPFGSAQLPQFLRLTFDTEGRSFVMVAIWNFSGHRCGVYVRQCSDSLQKTVIEIGTLARGSVFRFWKGHTHGEDRLRIGFEVRCKERS